MRISALIIACIGLSFGVKTSARAEELKPSRPPEKGCEWKPFESRPLGLRMLVQDCADPNMKYVFSTKGPWIEQHRPADDVTFNGPHVIRVFTKKAGQTLEAAIQSTIVSKLKSPEQRRSCKVKPAEGLNAPDEKTFVEIVPTGAYEKKIMAELKEGPRDFGCGPFGKGQGTTYFEYHPSESRTKFLFVIYGMDAPLFDEKSISLGAGS